MGCVTSAPREKRSTLSKIDSRSTNGSYSSTIEGIDHETDSENHKMNLFISKYKLYAIADVIYNEGITMDFLLSQDEDTTFVIAQEITSNLIQRNKFIYAVTAEKKERAIHNSSHQMPSPPNSNPSIHPTDTLHSSKDTMVTTNDLKSIRIYIESAQITKTKPLNVSMADTIEKVKRLYLQTYPYSDNNQQHKIEMLSLSYCGADMQNHLTLEDYGVVPDCELHLEIRSVQSIRFQRKPSIQCLEDSGSSKHGDGHIQNHIESSSSSFTAISRDPTSSYSSLSSNSSDRIRIFVQMKRHRKCKKCMDTFEGF